jgi:hypothetical protein
LRTGGGDLDDLPLLDNHDLVVGFQKPRGLGPQPILLDGVIDLLLLIEHGLSQPLGPNQVSGHPLQGLRKPKQ